MMRIAWLFLLLVSHIGFAHAQDIDSGMFWLSKKDRHLMPLLVDAAKLASETSKCAKIIDGSKSSSKSTSSNPVFFITCENLQGTPYNIFESPLIY
jgi:hypothetical protein